MNARTASLLQSLRDRFTRYLLALGVVTAATLFRLAVDPLLHDQVPYFVYVAAVVVAAWFAGAGPGIVATIVSAFVGNFLFVPPRYEIAFTLDDAESMGTFAALSAFVVWMVSRWRKAEREVRDLQARTAATAETSRRRAEELQAIFDTVPAGVVIAQDPNAGRLVGNRFMAEVLHLPLGERSVSNFSTERSNRPVFRNPHDGREIPTSELPVRVAAAQGVDVAGVEFDVVHQDGTVRTLLGNASPLRDRDGRLRGAVGAFVDVTERRRMEAELRTQADELGRANRMKDDFLSTLSHELRTPLNAILGWSDMLVRGRLDAHASARALEAINRNAHAQAAIIADVLDVSRIISGKMRLDVRPVEVATILAAAIDTAKPAADARKITIDSTVEEGLFLLGDPDRLQQVFWNLLSNSVKFSESGGRIMVAAGRVDSRVEVRISDTGIGIPAHFLPHVFERFRQLDSSTTRNHQSGLGLGLAIVRHLTELHGGTVRAESAGEGTGATFVVSLPVRAVLDHQASGSVPSATAVDATRRSVSPAALAGVRVLVVDDQPDARALIETVLREAGAHVIACASAAAGLEAIEREHPNVMIADIGMPGMDGYELVRRVRTRLPRASAAMPCIALTAYGAVEDRRHALESGFDEHLVKPVAPEHLVAVISDIARTSRMA